jgi:hypothetical protein
MASSAQQAITQVPEPILIPWKPKKRSLNIGPNHEMVHRAGKETDISLDLTLGAPSPFPAISFSPATPLRTASLLEMIGAGAPDKEPSPEQQQQIQAQLPFDFFGLGQQVVQ